MKAWNKFTKKHMKLVADLDHEKMAQLIVTGYYSKRCDELWQIILWHKGGVSKGIQQTFHHCRRKAEYYRAEAHYPEGTRKAKELGLKLI